MKKHKEPRVLFFDIETRPNLAYVWGKWEQNVLSYTEEWSMLCFAYKWQGEKKTHCIAMPDFKDKTDKTICRKLWKLLNEADLVIAHNAVKFDIKKANARFLYHGFKPTDPYVVVDTLIEAKKRFKFNSNKLGDLGEHLNLGNKEETGGFDLWLGCMSGKKSAWDKMKKYNKQDVVLLEQVYHKLRPWIERHPNLSMINRERNCPNCGGTHIWKKGVKALYRTVKQKYQCQECKAWFLGPAGKKLPEYDYEC